MPDLGGKKFAGDFSGLLGSAKRALAAAQLEIGAAAAELVTEINTGKTATVRALNQETDAVRKGYAELLGNAPPEAEETKVEAEKPTEPEKPNTEGS